MKRVLWVGSRHKVYEAACKMEELDIVAVLALKNSSLHRSATENGARVQPFTGRDREAVLQQIAECEFDLLISNGFPFLIPVSKIAKSHQRFVNVHPSYLPHLRGMHPANGVFLHNYEFAGATMHFMADAADTGNIIQQDKFEVTEDVDLGLLYHMLFELEARVFEPGIRKLLADKNFEGTSQQGVATSYTRKPEEMQVNFAEMEEDEIIRRVRAFGVKTQGVGSTLGGTTYRLFEIEIVSHPFLLSMYSDVPAGEIAAEYDGKLLVRSRNGLVKVKGFVEESTPR